MSEIKEKGELLNDAGELAHVGFSKNMLLNYNRKSVKACSLKIKEWDYYLIYNANYALALTVADNSYMGLLSGSVIDFNMPNQKTKTFMTWFPLGKLNKQANTRQKINMPGSSVSGDVIFRNKHCDFRFMHDGKNRSLYCYIKNFYKKEDLEANIFLTTEPKESIVVSTPFSENNKLFYYNQKTVGFKASGKVAVGDKEFTFKSTNSYGIFDWGRGVWPYKSTWFWGAACGKINDNLVAFNIGYGFGNNSETENAIFYNGVVHKLNDVTFNISTNEKGKENYLQPWKFTSSDNRFEMNFVPLIDRHSDTNALVLRSNQHQVFGHFNGFLVLDDGTKIEVNNMLGFAEKVYNKW